jgi:hypothetical protein
VRVALAGAEQGRIAAQLHATQRPTSTRLLARQLLLAGRLLRVGRAARCARDARCVAARRPRWALGRRPRLGAHHLEAAHRLRADAAPVRLDERLNWRERPLRVGAQARALAPASLLQHAEPQVGGGDRGRRGGGVQPLPCALGRRRARSGARRGADGRRCRRERVRAVPARHPVCAGAWRRVRRRVSRCGNATCAQSELCTSGVRRTVAPLAAA